jgi:hypothetical protein
LHPPKDFKAPARHDDDHDRGPKIAVLLLKAFFTAAALGLVVSTLLGIWMALRDGRKRLVNLLLLLAGAAVPAVLAALTA